MRAMVTDHRLRLKKTLDLPNGIIEGVGGHFDRKLTKGGKSYETGYSQVRFSRFPVNRHAL
jgi:hypothetical protein